MAKLTKRVWLPRGMGFVTYKKGTDSNAIPYDDLKMILGRDLWDDTIPVNPPPTATIGNRTRWRCCLLLR